MKRIAAILATLVMFAGTVFAQDSKAIYNKYSDSDDVSAVYISSSMFKLIGKLPSMEFGSSEMNLAPLIKTLDCMYVIDCDDSGTIRNIKEDLSKYMKKNKFEMLMEVKDNGEVVRIYTSGDDSTVTHFILTAAEDDDQYTLICLDGTMNRKELEKIIAKAAKELN